MPCPICNHTGILVSSLPASYIRQHLAEDYAEAIPEDLGIIDYEMYRCPECTLVYASPLTPGSARFYEWLTRHTGYYPSRRWEWDLALAYIQKHNVRSVLEVGCGNGVFLKKCNQIAGVHAVGLDTNRESVDACLRAGVEASCETIEEYVRSHDEKFDLVVSFHCLEHVADPKNFIRSQLSLVKDGGTVLASTPYTATPGEPWYETLNYPPHHMTQWNHASYAALANQLHLSVRLFMPPGGTFPQRFINSLGLLCTGLHGRTTLSRKEFLRAVARYSLTHPVRTAQEALRHATRERREICDLVGGTEIKRYQPVAYVALAAFVL
jgi:2-polyprenyl-3-methyl-5-hydroxy-6-metoxy-1,4-benzoquinol methylase